MLRQNSNSNILSKSELKVYRRYHSPKGLYFKREVNIVHKSDAESNAHKNKKKKICQELKLRNHKFITEAVRNYKDRNGVLRRVDIVDLTCDIEIEIETQKSRAKRFLGEEGVMIVMAK